VRGTAIASRSYRKGARNGKTTRRERANKGGIHKERENVNRRRAKTVKLWKTNITEFRGRFWDLYEQF
jgi:hypothetical protein